MSFLVIFLVFLQTVINLIMLSIGDHTKQPGSINSSKKLYNIQQHKV